MNKKKAKLFSFYISKNQKQDLKAMSESEKRSMGSIIRIALGEMYNKIFN